MLSYILRRLVRMAGSLLAVSLITFGLLQLVPGSFAEMSQLGSTAMGDQPLVDSEAIAAQKAEEIPAWQKYLTFMWGLVRWDIGPTYKFPSTTVETLIGDAFPISLSIAVPSLLLTLVIAIPVGMLAAVKKDRPADYGSIFTLTTIQALPGYLFALLLILVFAVGLDMLPVRGWKGPEYMIIPVVALAVQPTAALARYVRSSMLEALRDEYVVAALAKGGSQQTVLIRHVLRNSLIPLVTVVGPIFAGLATGTAFIEVLLGIPGLGRLFTLAARTRDMPLLMGTTLFFAVILMTLNLLVDIAYGFLDPRIRHQQKAPGSGWRRPKRPDHLKASRVFGQESKAKDKTTQDSGSASQAGATSGVSQ